MIDYMAIGAMGANCGLFVCDETKKGAIIDPGGQAQKIIQWVSSKEVAIEAILLTHGHFDHIGAVDELRDHFNAAVYIHRADAPMLNDPAKNLSQFFGMPMRLKEADHLLSDQEVIKIGNQDISVLATPGHTPGGVCFLTSEALFGGDTLFEGSIGRTDLPGGSLDQLVNGIQKKLLSLPDDTRVIPGHGAETTIGREKRENPFLS